MCAFINVDTEYIADRIALIFYTNRIFTAPPNYSPEICIESNGEIKKIKVAPNNHFEEMLIHFSILIKTKKNLSDEYSQNINQSRLVHEVRQKAH